MKYYRLFVSLERELAALEFDTSSKAEKRRQEIHQSLYRLQLFILNIPDATIRLLLLKRFIEKKRWRQIAVELNYSESHIYRLRTRALLALLPFVDEIKAEIDKKK